MDESVEYTVTSYPVETLRFRVQDANSNNLQSDFRASVAAELAALHPNAVWILSPLGPALTVGGFGVAVVRCCPNVPDRDHVEVAQRLEHLAPGWDVIELFRPAE